MRSSAPASARSHPVILIFPVIPAQAGIYALRWTPVFAGATVCQPNHLKTKRGPTAICTSAGGGVLL